MLTHKEKLSLLLRRLFSKNGFDFFTMSRFEEYDFYADKKDFLTSKNILTFTDADGRLMALRPDVTLSLIKNAGTGKYHYSEKVYRVPKNSSSFREISQSGLEIIGNVGNEEINEVMRLALSSLETLAEGRNYILTVADAGNILQNLDGLNKPEALRLLSQKNIHGLKEIGASEKLIALAQTNSNFHGYEHVRIDYSVAENLMYYDGVIMKGYIDGIPEAVLSGGQYNIMNMAGIGFAVYLDLIERGNHD